MTEHEDNKPVPFDAMLHHSAMVYTFASLRKVVNAHCKTFGDQDDEHEKVEFIRPELIVTKNAARDMEHRKNAYLKNCVSFDAVLEFVQLNRKYFDNDGEFNPEWKTASETTHRPTFEAKLKAFAERVDADIWEFDDEFAKKELVYGLIVIRSEKRIVISFRGSYSKRDWLTDAMCLWSIPDELKFAHEMNYVNKYIPVCIHRGFSNYLFAKRPTGEGSKFEDILNDIKEVYAYKEGNRDYSDYKLFVTGHSLGGALSSLLAVALAGSKVAETLPAMLPVTAITYASPRVAGRAFRATHEGLERAKKLRHIRVSNDKDVVPVGGLPTYVQTGVNVHVYSSCKAAVGYMADAWFIWQIGFATPWSHSLRGSTSYTKHLHAQDGGAKLNEDLLKMSMKDMYGKYANIEV